MAITTPLKNPYDTRVLPAVVLPAAPLLVPRPAPAQAPTTTPAARRRLVVDLQGHNRLEIWDDRVTTHDQIFALDDTFGARVTPDWRAPLTVEAPLGLALRDERGRWNIYVPVDEEQVWHAASLLRAVCAARGLDLPGLDPTAVGATDESDQAWHILASAPAAPAPAAAPVSAPARHAYERTHPAPVVRLSAGPVVARAPSTREIKPFVTPPAPGLPASEPTSDTVLILIAHLSVVFLPVLLPLTIWLALRRSVPVVADQARQAAGFQAVVAALGAVLFGVAVHGALTHASMAATVALAAFVALLAVAAATACAVALRALRGDAFRYLDVLQVPRRR
jgi:uncharacterized Tic20 family protein